MKTILVILIGYIIGSFSPSYYFGKIFKKMDIRDYGSGNAGTTNALRVFGKKVGILTFIMDIVKGIIAVLIGRWILGFNGELLAAIFVVLGHNWPIFLDFKGGKGIATSFGVLLMIHWQIGLIAFIIFISVIVLTKYVSLGSISATLFAPLALIITNRGAPIKLHLTMIFLAALAIYRHKDNIKRLLKGEENRIGNIKG
ncbi:MAG TPA: glycerol-3-phosphate 1-O-acyltransferase PlsY [Tissierellaceae bacterium]|nr:glycerol-3-phosphate 1-O-acyltransferase PlsY [Tissierellaceae bacterium]